MNKSTLLDITAQRFGRLLVECQAPSRDGRAYWYCLCDCGKTVVVIGKNLRNGNTRSCGCLKRELDLTRHITHGETIHGIPREYRAWSAAKSRCYDPALKCHPDYGGRGIKMSDDWRDDYAAFLRDMGRCPIGHSLDRIDTNGDYAPSNCRWATKSQQMNNMRSNHHLTHEGKRQTIAEWAREKGWNIDTLKIRILRGWSDHRALTQPLRPSRSVK